jgi:predicted dinucleotide-binding enzyme
MAVKKTIAIIGANDELSAAIAKTLRSSNYRLLLISRDKRKAARKSSSLMRKAYPAEVTVIDCEKEACWEADVILMAVPDFSEKEVADLIREVTTQKVVISFPNLLSETYERTLISADISIEELQDVLPYAKVVKVKTTLHDIEYDSSRNNELHVTTFITGDDEESLQTAGEIVTAMGLSPVVIVSDSKQFNFLKM